MLMLQARMDHLVTVNPSGLRGGGMFRDKLNEIYVKFIKNALRHQNSALRHMTIARMVQSASVMAHSVKRA